MDLLGNLLGQGEDRTQARDFVDRYERGAPWDGIGDDEAVDRYRRVAPNLRPDEYEESAAEAFSRLDPEQRRELGRHLASHARERGTSVDEVFDDDSSYEDPRRLGRASARLESQQPGILADLLGGGGGGGGGMLSNPIAKAALAGVAAMAMKKVMGGR